MTPARHGVDEGGGVWLSFHSPISSRGVVYVRFTETGIPDRCYRPADDERIAAFGRDNVVIITEGDDGDAINVKGTAKYPAR